MKEPNVTDILIDKLSSTLKSEQISTDDFDLFEKELNSLSPTLNSLNIPFLIQNIKSALNAITPKNIDTLIAELNSHNIFTKAIASNQKVSKQFNTKCENIIEKLKEIRNAAQELNDLHSTFDIDWIIKTINEENIYEIDPLVVTNEELNTEDNKNGLDYLIQYSKIEDLKQKTKDFKAVRGFTRSNTFSSKENQKIIKDGVDTKRRESADVISTMVSPSISAKLITMMSRIEYPDFDIFELDELMNEKASVLIANEILKRVDFVNSGVIDIGVLRNFIVKVVDSYSRTNALYHNDLHAADVMQTLFTMIMRGDLQSKMKLGDLDKFSILIGAICHDLKHTGQNNIFHINTRSKIAMKYNDISVLENFHIAQTFKLLSIDEYNILKNFKPEEYRILRRRMIEGILATDMANHQKVLSATKAKIETYKIKNGENFNKIFDVETGKLFDAQQVILNMCLHTADISNPAKPGKISEAWTQKVYAEFFRQGDTEKKLNIQVSLMCDRETTSINKAMIGFINFVVKPTIDILVNLIPQVNEYEDNIICNLKKYENALAIEKEAKEKETESEKK